jgi:hypothetical protein
VYAHSTDTAIKLAEIYPSLYFIVQMIEPAQNGNGAVVAAGKAVANGQITVQKRMPGAAQTVKDAAIYILRLNRPSLSPSAQVLAELSAHLGVLSANPMSTLILAAPLLPEPLTVDPECESMARVRDLYHMQLTNGCEMELDMLAEMMNSVQDARGRLVIINKLRSRNSATVALGVKYQAYADDPLIASDTLNLMAMI